MLLEQLRSDTELGSRIESLAHEHLGRQVRVRLTEPRLGSVEFGILIWMAAYQMISDWDSFSRNLSRLARAVADLFGGWPWHLPRHRYQTSTVTVTFHVFGRFHPGPAGVVPYRGALLYLAVANAALLILLVLALAGPLD
jgi:hypothetical protein